MVQIRVAATGYAARSINGRSEKRQMLQVKRNFHLAIYMSWGNVLGAKIVEHDFYLNGVAVKALVHLRGLDEVANV